MGKNMYIYTFLKQRLNIAILKEGKGGNGPINIEQELYNFCSINRNYKFKSFFNSFESYF